MGESGLVLLRNHRARPHFTKSLGFGVSHPEPEVRMERNEVSVVMQQRKSILNAPRCNNPKNRS
jgi:hypothetical protein